MPLCSLEHGECHGVNWTLIDYLRTQHYCITIKGSLRTRRIFVPEIFQIIRLYLSIVIYYYQINAVPVNSL